jgi:hypothetical protein
MEKDHKDPKRKTKMGSGKVICSMTGMQDTLEEKGSAIESKSVKVKVQWKNIKKCVLDVMSGMIYKVDRKARKPWIATEMTNRMDERRKQKNVNNEEGMKNYRR